MKDQREVHSHSSDFLFSGIKIQNQSFFYRIEESGEHLKDRDSGDTKDLYCPSQNKVCMSKSAPKLGGIVAMTFFFF